MEENMKLEERLINCALPLAEGRTVADVRIGLGYTCVMLDDGACGLAYTFRNELGHVCGVLNDAGSLIGQKAAEVIPYAEHKSRVRAAVGLATLNAAVNNDPNLICDGGNIVDALDIKESDTFGMVGQFGPILAYARRRTQNIYVFERNPAKGGSLYPEDAIPDYLPKCDVVVVTATSIINHTADGVLSQCKSAREVCVVGPSTPLCKEAFADYHVTTLAGSLVQDQKKALETVSQGGGTMNLRPFVRQVLVKMP